MAVSDNIRRLRTSHGLTQAEFGEIAGVTDKAVSTWESGAKFPRVGTARRIADHFGIKMADILDDVETAERDPADRIGERLKRRRAELGLTLEQIGAAVGVGKSTVRKWENGSIQNMKIDKIALLSEILRISPMELIGGEDDGYLSPAEKKLLTAYRDADPVYGAAALDILLAHPAQGK